MNLDQNPTTADLAALLSPCRDKESHHILWVDFEGNVHVSPVPADLAPVGWAKSMEGKFKFRYETYVRGNGYVGPEAVKHQEFLESTLEDLKKDWAKGSHGYIDY